MGLLRLFLALSVIAGHSGATIFGFKGIEAGYAVNFFFIISGFYMAMVLNEKYRTTSPIAFYKSRALRLFPTYYIGLTIALAVSFGTISTLYSDLTDKSKIFYILQNIFMFGQDLSYLLCANNNSGICVSPVELTINPPAWSLAVELGFYLIAPFVLKSEKKVFSFITFGCAYLIAVNNMNFPLSDIKHLAPVGIGAFNYYFYPASFIFFGCGAMAYHMSKRTVEPHYWAAISIVLMLSFAADTVMPFWHLLLISLAIPVLFKYTARNKLDRFVGELSYPAYILHFPILVCLRPFAQTHPGYFSILSLGSWVAIASCSIGLLIYLFIEKKIDSYRHSESFFRIDTSSTAKKVAIRPLVTAYFALPIIVVAYVLVSQKIG